VLEALRSADGQAVIYSDVLEYIDRENELPEGLELERKLLAKLKRGHDPTAGVLKTKLLPYQARGAIFAACRGRAVLADDMGLGKTVQALAMAELLHQRGGNRKSAGNCACLGQIPAEDGDRKVHRSLREDRRRSVAAATRNVCDPGVFHPH
jgi:hypothetical protein